MNAEYINLFISAVESVFGEVAQTKLLITGKGMKTDNVMKKNVAVIIGITGHIRGSIIVSMDVNYAKATASQMMCGMPIADFDKMAQSAIREIGNMMMGRVASLIEQEGKIIDITPPTLIIGEGLSIPNQFSPTLVLTFSDQANGSTVDMDIAIKEA